MNFKENTAFYYVLLLLLMFCTQLPAQKVADSLKDVSYDYMWERFYADTTRASQIIYTDAIIGRTKREKDTVILMGGYSLRSQMSKGKTYLKYLDSIIELGERKPIYHYPGVAYLSKGRYYLYKENNPKKALDYFIKVKEYNTNSDFLRSKINYHIANIKYDLGDKISALKMYKEHITTIDFNDKKNLKNNISEIFNISTIYNELKLLDSAKYYIDLGTEITLKLKDRQRFYHFSLNRGIYHYYNNQFEQGKIEIEKVIDSVKFMPNVAIGRMYLGKIKKNLNTNKGEVRDYIIADSIITELGETDQKFREIYVDLVEHFKKNKDYKSQYHYINKLITIDSIARDNREYLGKNLYTGYEIPKLKAERDQIILDIKDKDQQKKNWIIVLLAGSILILSGFIYQYYKRKSYQAKFITLVNHQEDEKKVVVPATIKESSYQLDISEEIIAHILEGLQQFENDHDYKKSELTLTILAKQLQTNSKYLSKVISTKKGKTFVQYINGLRVNHAIKKIKSNSSFRKYTLLAIANEVGFKKSESFTNAFKKETGISPSYFIKELQKKDLNLSNNNASVLL